MQRFAHSITEAGNELRAWLLYQNLLIHEHNRLAEEVNRYDYVEYVHSISIEELMRPFRARTEPNDKPAAEE